MAILHHAGRDYIASRGEYLNAMVLAAYLGFDFIDAEKGIFFNEDGTFDSEKQIPYFLPYSESMNMR